MCQKLPQGNQPSTASLLVGNQAEASHKEYVEPTEGRNVRQTLCQASARQPKQRATAARYLASAVTNPLPHRCWLETKQKQAHKEYVEPTEGQNVRQTLWQAPPRQPTLYRIAAGWKPSGSRPQRIRRTDRRSERPTNIVSKLPQGNQPSTAQPLAGNQAEASHKEYVEPTGGRNVRQTLCQASARQPKQRATAARYLDKPLASPVTNPLPHRCWRTCALATLPPLHNLLSHHPATWTSRWLGGTSEGSEGRPAKTQARDAAYKRRRFRDDQTVTHA